MISGVNQGYHQKNWDNPGYPSLVTGGPKRVGTGATPTARRRRGEHICPIFVQCWEKTSLGHRGCHCRIAAAGGKSQPSESDPRPLAAARHHQQSWGAYFCIFVIFICTSFSSFTIFYAYIVNIQHRRWCSAYFASHTVVTNFEFLRRVTC